MPVLRSYIDQFRVVSGRMRDRLRLRWRQSVNEWVLRRSERSVRIRIHAPLAGLGAHLNMAVILLAACARRHLVPHFRFTSPQYGRADGSFDWLGELYQQPTEDDAHAPEILITRWADLSVSFRQQTRTDPRALANRVTSHFRLHPQLAMQLAVIRDDVLQRRPTLGVHYRGTDKAAEAPVVPISEMLDAVAEALRADASLEQVFIATDSQPFLEAAGDSIAGRPVRSIAGTQRALDNAPVHFAAHGDRTSKARQALLDALVLSTCARLIKTESGLSQWSTLLNPDLPVQQLNARYQVPVWAPWFPVELFAAAPPRVRPSLASPAVRLST